jgi:hypothetical protein
VKRCGTDTNRPAKIKMVAAPARLERATSDLAGQCSIQLSYGTATKYNDQIDSSNLFWGERVGAHHMLRSGNNNPALGGESGAMR